MFLNGSGRCAATPLTLRRDILPYSVVKSLYCKKYPIFLKSEMYREATVGRGTKRLMSGICYKL